MGLFDDIPEMATKKYGPLPGWAYVAIGTGAVFFYSRRKSSASTPASAAAAGDNSNSATPADDSSYVGTPGYYADAVNKLFNGANVVISSGANGTVVASTDGTSSTTASGSADSGTAPASPVIAPVIPTQGPTPVVSRAPSVAGNTYFVYNPSSKHYEQIIGGKRYELSTAAEASLKAKADHNISAAEAKLPMGPGQSTAPVFGRVTATGEVDEDLSNVKYHLNQQQWANMVRAGVTVKRNY